LPSIAQEYLSLFIVNNFLYYFNYFWRYFFKFCRHYT